jgi:hypothetical protein
MPAGADTEPDQATAVGGREPDEAGATVGSGGWVVWTALSPLGAGVGPRAMKPMMSLANGTPCCSSANAKA